MLHVSCSRLLRDKAFLLLLLLLNFNVSMTMGKLRAAHRWLSLL